MATGHLMVVEIDHQEVETDSPVVAKGPAMVAVTDHHNSLQILRVLRVLQILMYHNNLRDHRPTIDIQIHHHLHASRALHPQHVSRALHHQHANHQVHIVAEAAVAAAIVVELIVAAAVVEVIEAAVAVVLAAVEEEEDRKR